MRLCGGEKLSSEEESRSMGVQSKYGCRVIHDECSLRFGAEFVEQRALVVDSLKL